MSIEVTDLVPIGHGIERPEQVVVTSDGRLFASDRGSAVAEILDENRIRRIGNAGGEPNGIAVDRRGHFLIANFGSGVLQDLDPESGEITTVVSGEVDGRPLKWLNYVLVDSAGALWCSVSTATDDLLETITLGTADGYIFRVAPDRSSAAIVAENIQFPNCMALDRDETHLYAARTLAADAVRFPIVGTTLSEQEPYGPALGSSQPEEYGAHAPALFDDAQAGQRWGMADGCAFDADGNLWVTLVLANRIVAVTPGGHVTVVVEDTEGKLLSAPTSVAWGGPDMRDVYIGSIATPYVLKGRSSVPGMPMVHQR
jgi:sugar lactone lactonase YvrE